MTAAYALTPLAEADLGEIASYIAADSADAAERFIHEAYEAFAKLAEQPGLGHRRPDLTARPVRFWPVMRHYLIVYRETQPLQILRVRSGYQDLAALLG